MLNSIKSTQGAWALCRRELSVNVGKMGFAHLPLYNIKTKGVV